MNAAAGCALILESAASGGTARFNGAVSSCAFKVGRVAGGRTFDEGYVDVSHSVLSYAASGKLSA